MTPRIESLEKMIGGTRDGALLRFSLGNEYLKAGAPSQAVACFQAAVDFDAGYSAAWKALGKALAEQGEAMAACSAYEKGIATAEAKGDIQAAKEMKVFLKRVQKSLDATPAQPAQ